MATQSVRFEYVTGLKRPIFRNAQLRGSWDAAGRYSDTWTDSPMQEVTGTDGCPVFTASVSLDTADAAKTFRWGVVLDGPQGTNFWGIPTEVQDVNSAERYREFRMQAAAGAAQVERYHFTHCRLLGANKYFPTSGATPRVRFAVWAPNAQGVDVVFGDPARGYIAEDGTGIDATRPAIPLKKNAHDIWEGISADDFATLMSVPYMYRIKNAQGDTRYRTDIFSRGQIGRGEKKPPDPAWDGTPNTLDGIVGCTLVIDPDVVRRTFQSTPAGSPPDLIPDDEFWSAEFTSGVPVPTRLEDLVIYELHIEALGFGRATPGDLGDAMQFLDHVSALGVNAIELLPMAEYGGQPGWGYGDSHHMCIDSSIGGRDKYRHFVRECHRRGIAVLQDVVYNHYAPDVERAEWQYDSTAPEQNIYFWYEGKTSDYPNPDDGYLDNGSTGYTPRFWEENVRQQFISGAAFLLEEMHVDGLRVDLTQALHRDNVLHKPDHRPVSSANIFGAKFLREWSRTLHMIRPSAMLIAEDHTGWDAVTKTPAQGGLGFNAKWEVAFYHTLIGDSDMAGNRAKLLKRAGFGFDDPLQMDWFAGVLYNTQYNQVVFHESHDEAGNAGGTARTIVVAVNYAALFGPTRVAAEARSRLCCGLSILSAGTPMFFMGEEIGAQKFFRYNDFVNNREDILGETTGTGKLLFGFYQDVITLSRRFRSIRGHNIDILYQSNNDRVIAFKRWSGDEQVIIVASLNNTPFSNGYVLEKDALAIPDAGWKEVFNSDGAAYGGQNVGNFGAIVQSRDRRIEVKIPANGFVVLVKQ